MGIILNRITKKPHYAASYLGPFLKEIGALENHEVISKTNKIITYWKVSKINDDVSIQLLIEEYFSDN